MKNTVGLIVARTEALDLRAAAGGCTAECAVYFGPMRTKSLLFNTEAKYFRLMSFRWKRDNRVPEFSEPLTESARKRTFITRLKNQRPLPQLANRSNDCHTSKTPNHLISLQGSAGSLLKVRFLGSDCSIIA